MMKPSLRLISKHLEWIEKESLNKIPSNVRGIYALYKKRKKLRPNGKACFDVLYVGMALFGVKQRLREHLKTKDAWTHFSIFEVWPNINDQEIAELEGLLRHIYRRDSRANALNVQKGFGAVKKTDRIRLKNDPSADT